MKFDLRRIDAETRPIHEVMKAQAPPIRRDNYLQMRGIDWFPIEIPASVQVEKTTVANGDFNVPVLIYRQPQDAPQAAILWIHGGGHILGRADDTRAPLIADELNVTVFSVDYRLAPEYTYKDSMEDCYTALSWLFDNAETLNIDPQRIVIVGESAGGGKCAGLTLMNRDRTNYPIKLQLLLYPMLDNLHTTENDGSVDLLMCDIESVKMFWKMYLGGTPGLDASPYAAPTRAKDLSNLPPTYICVGSEDLFRDECIDYGQRLYIANTPCELAVFPGMTHGSENFAPEAKVSRRLKQSYMQALRDALV